MKKDVERLKKESAATKVQNDAKDVQPEPEEPKEKPKPMIYNERKGKWMPAILELTCGCGQQHWGKPKNGTCVLCLKELPTLPKEPTEEKRFGSQAYKQLVEDLNEPEATLAGEDPEERKNKIAKAQANLDLAIQMNFPEASQQPLK